jgi:integrase
MLFKRAGSSFWYVDYRDASGRRVKRSTGTADRREAQELEGKWRLEVRNQRLWGAQPRYTFDELMLRYLQETQPIKRSAMQDVYSVKHLQRVFSGRHLDEIKRADVRQYIANRKRQGVKGSSVNREIGLLSSAFNRARLEWDWQLVNPAEGMREPEGEGRKVFLTREQFDALVSAASQQDRAPYLGELVTVAVMTGCRRGELLGLEWSRVDLAAGVVRLGAVHTKAAKARIVPLNAIARAALLKRLEWWRVHAPSSPWVFCGPEGERLAGVKSSFRHALRTAGLAGVRFHDLRHTCGSWLAQAGVPEGHIAAVLGHSTVRMTERYAHLAPANAREAVEKLGGLSQSCPTTLTEETVVAGNA